MLHQRVSVSWLDVDVSGRTANPAASSPRYVIDLALEGGTGLIFGRNVWQREHDESPRFASALRANLEKHPGQARSG